MRIENIPEHLCRPPGIIADVASFCHLTTQRKHPEFGLSTGLALLSVLVGRKVVDETGTTANLFVLNLGSTGCGKEKYRNTLKHLLRNESLLSSESFTSDSAFVNELMNRPSMICCNDEVGSTIEELNNSRASSHIKNLTNAWTQVYSCAGGVWSYKGFADSAKSKTVTSPNFVLYGSGNPTSLFKAIRPEKISDGFVGRFTMFLSENGGGHCSRLAKLAADRNNPREGEFSPSLPVPESISDFIARWQTFKSDDGLLHNIPPVPHIVERSHEAAQRLQEHFEEIHQRGRDECGTIRGDLWARASEKSAKFSLLAAVSRSSDLIQIEDANWGIALSNFLTRRLVKMCTRHVAETPWDAKRLEILRRIQDSDQPIEHSVLLKASRVRSKEFQDMISNLMECGDVVFAVKLATGRQGRQATGYAAASATLRSQSSWRIVTAEELEAAKKK